MSTTNAPRPVSRLTTKATPQLNRETFRTSREMDFFSQKELVTQTGHEMPEWPLVVAKELLDNALDACDEFEIPVIDVIADAAGITAKDNGPGLPDAASRAHGLLFCTSNREAYVAPDRGARGTPSRHCCHAAGDRPGRWPVHRRVRRQASRHHLRSRSDFPTGVGQRRSDRPAKM